MNPAAVIVILNGSVVASAPPAQLLFGHVMAPLAPVITRFTERAAVDGDTITLVRDGRTCVFRIGSDAFTCDGVISVSPVAPFGRDGVAYVPLAEVVHAFGGAIAYDPRARAVALEVVQCRAAQDAGAVRSERTVGDADDRLHAVTGARDPDAAPARERQPDAASHGDSRDPLTRSGELKTRVGDRHDPALRLRVVPPVRDARLGVVNAA